MISGGDGIWAKLILDFPPFLYFHIYLNYLLFILLTQIFWVEIPNVTQGFVYVLLNNLLILQEYY